MGSSGQLSRRLAEEDGFGLIEVITAAALLLVIMLATLGVFDAMAKTSGQSKARTVAATLAEQDQERLRGLKAVDLSNRHETRTVGANGQADPKGAYTVESRVDWMRDAAGAESCTTNGAQAEYLRVTSTVRSPILGTGKSVRTSSLVAPPVAAFSDDTGTLTVKVTARDTTTPVPGVDVAISGPTSLSDTTNSLGCAVFSHVPVGTYSGTTSRPDYVDPDGDSPGDVSGVVSAGKVTVVGASFDLAAKATAVSFQTYVNPYSGFAGSTGWRPSQARSLTAGGPSGPEVVKKGAWQTAIEVAGLYPFTAGYGMYSGSCATADPTKLPTSSANYFTTYPDSLATTNPGGSASVIVRQPPLAVRVQLGSPTGSAVAGAKVVATATGVGCGADRFDDLLSDANGFVTHPGAAFDPGLPFGTYSLCASVKSPADPTKYLVGTATYANTSFSPTAAAALVIPSDVSGNRTGSPCT
jgi:Tfp pilus assembly protein PilV